MFSSGAKSLFFPSSLPTSSIYFSINPHELLNLHTILEKVKTNEACVYWYVGANGLKQGAIDFYRGVLSHNIKQGATPFLVDLTAWGAFKNKNNLINKYHESAISLDGEKIKTLKCSDFFSRLSQIRADEPVYPLFADIIKRNELLLPSVSFSQSGITVGEVFNHQCEVLQPLFSLDCAKSYSLIQYMEFLFLVEMILAKKSEIETIKFILPNDEAKYYLSSIKEDLQFFLAARKQPFHSLQIEVQCFQFGDAIFQRPYNCPSKTISSKKRLTIDDIIDPMLEDKPAFHL